MNEITLYFSFMRCPCPSFVLRILLASVKLGNIFSVLGSLCKTVFLPCYQRLEAFRDEASGLQLFASVDLIVLTGTFISEAE